jgi:hypothetical protein
MGRALLVALGLLGLLTSVAVSANDQIELKTTTIKGNKELPRIIYVVPWKEIQNNKRENYRMVLHSLYGDLFDPVLPGYAVQQHTQSR